MDDMELALKRVKELQAQGLDWGHAWPKRNLEQRIQRWPTGWGDDFHILIYGDFEPPTEDLHISALGITVNHLKREGTIIKSAMCVLEASVRIEDKSIPAIIDAIRRINLFLGVFNLIEWGNGSIGWWSHITHGGGCCAMVKLGEKDLNPTICAFLELSKPVKQKVDAALYWLKEPRNLLYESYRSDLMRVYSAYWNAFECLVDATNLIKQQSKLSRTEKQKRIDDFIEARGGRLTSEDIAMCYLEIVNPGFKNSASHALRVCFPSDADRYINECFEMREKRDRLYQIRNAIDHGDIDAENPEELIRVESRLVLLQGIVWGMFPCIILHRSSMQEGPGLIH